jgi:O-antigen/teichoic acid export membrane protein
MVALLGATAHAQAIWGNGDGIHVESAVSDPAQPRATKDAGALAADIAWSTAPPVGLRHRLALDPRWTVVARAGDDPLLAVASDGVVLAIEANDESNAPFRRWGYFEYLAYAATVRAAGRPPVPFVDYPWAPVPHARARRLLAAAAIGLALLLFALFLLARRRARAHPDAWRPFFAALSHPPEPHERHWTRPGIARPLAGFFLFLSATLIAMGPYLWLTAVLIPSRVQPFPDVDGTWAPVEELATLGWSLVDLGLSVAFIQRFAEHRVSDPARALKVAQTWIWWQLVTGLVLFSAAGTIACGILPHTRYALFSRVLLIRFAMQVPGVLSIFTLFFQAAQRFDYQLGLDLLEKRLLYVAVPVPFILALRAWGRAHPAIGEPFGALLGIAAGQYCALLVTCAIGFALYRRLRLPLRPLLYAGFDRATFFDMLRFGLGVVAGKAPFFIANTVEIVLITAMLPGYPAWLGIRNLILSRLYFTLYFLLPFAESGVPAFSEAFAAHKRELARYYVVRYLQFGHLFVAPVIALLVGAGRPLILHALKPEWRPAATWLPLATCAGLFLPAAWTSDSLLKGAGRAGASAAILIGEQVVRVSLVALLLPPLGFSALFLAVIAGLLFRCTVAWILNHARILSIQLHAWSSVVAPLVSGALWLGAIAGVAAALPSTRAVAVGVFVGAALLTFPAGFFLCGLVGGFDPAALSEVVDAAELAGPMRPVARLLSRAARAGARLSPIRRALPPLAGAAAREAAEIAALEATT